MSPASSGSFPQMVAGPIVRAFAFLPQLRIAPEIFGCRCPRRARSLPHRLHQKGLHRRCASRRSSTAISTRPGISTRPARWLAVLFYAIQIYCDFSGYTDMAIACARLLGYELPVNFRFPYFAREHRGVLASLAHQSFELAARLSLHSAGRKSGTALVRRIATS